MLALHIKKLWICVSGSFRSIRRKDVNKWSPQTTVFLYQHTQSFFIISFKSEFVVGYLNDCSIGDHVDKVIKDFLTLEADTSKLGLHLNRSKCEIIVILDFSRAQLKEKGILLNETDSAEACLLGSPLHMDGISQAITNKRSMFW